MNPLAEGLLGPPLTAQADGSAARSALPDHRAALLLIVACSALPIVAAALRFSGHATDDIFITYRYAANLASGRGLVFNPGERVFGLSDPLQAILLALAHRLTGIALPTLGAILTAVALLAAIAALCRATLTAHRPVHAAFGAALVVASVFPWLSQGAGPLPGLALLLWAGETSERHPRLAGALAGLAILVRPDLALGVGVLGVLLLWQHRAAVPRFVVGVLLTAVPVWACFALYFHQLLPGTFAAKHAFAAETPALFDRATFWRQAGQLFSFAHGPDTWVLVTLGLAGLMALFRSSALTLRLLAALAIVSAVFYTSLVLPFFVWYAFPTTIGLLYGAGFLIGEGLAAPAGRWPVRLAGAAIVAMVLFSFLMRDVLWWQRDLFPDWREWAYKAAGEWIHDHSTADQTIAAEEVGQLGYWSDRPVLDLVGLITPASISLRERHGALGAFLVKPADFLVLATGRDLSFSGQVVRQPWFFHAYRKAARLENPSLELEIVVFQLFDRRAVPAPYPD